MKFFGKDKDKDKQLPNRTDLIKLEEERFMLEHLKRGSEIGDFVTICRTDFVQSFSDTWISGFNYEWTEYLLLVKNLLEKPGDLSHLVFLPQDLSEVYYVVVPPLSPNHTHLSPQGRRDYEYSPGYEAAVDQAIARDYLATAKRSVFHSVEPQNAGWDLIAEAALAGKMDSVALEYNGVKYTYTTPRDPKEAASAFFTASATRRGAYPMEESLRQDRKYDIVPAIPDGVTGQVTVREFVADPRANVPFNRLSFQRTEVPAASVNEEQPRVMVNLSFGNDLGPQDSLVKYLSIKYVQVDYNNPQVRLLGQF